VSRCDLRSFIQVSIGQPQRSVAMAEGLE
jgi:hypothetical protein